jgi:hypothetical protein
LAVPFSLFALGALLFLTVRLDVMQTHLAVRQAARATRTALPASPDPAVEVLPTD